MMTRRNCVRLMAVVAAIALFGFYASNRVSGHEGHHHAPASAKSLKNPLSVNPETVEAGRQLFDKRCAVCHGQDGQAKTKLAASMKVKPTDLTAKAMHGMTDGEIYWVITNGITNSGMPALKAKTSETERWQMTLYVKHLMGEHQHAEHGPEH